MSEVAWTCPRCDRVYHSHHRRWVGEIPSEIGCPTTCPRHVTLDLDKLEEKLGTELAKNVRAECTP